MKAPKKIFCIMVYKIQLIHIQNWNAIGIFDNLKQHDKYAIQNPPIK